MTHDVHLGRLRLLDHTAGLQLRGLATAPVPLGPPGDEEEELELALQACRGTSRCLAFNLVSKCGYHIAEVLGVPCVCVSPSIPPPAPAPSKQTVRALLPPALRERLRRAELQAEEVSADSLGDGESKPAVAA